MNALKSLPLLTTLGFATASGLLAQPAEKPLFLLGTQEGDNTADPRPVESKYFRAQRGGFQVTQGFAGYVVYVEVIRKPRRTWYTRAILQNPLDPQSPFVYEHFIDKETGSSVLAHGPVKGLELHKDYKVELILYEDENRTKEIDRLTQLVRSYVDTAGPELKLSDRLQPKRPSKPAEPAPPPPKEAEEVPGVSLIKHAPALREAALSELASYAKEKHECGLPKILDTKHEADDGEILTDQRGRLISGVISERWTVLMCGEFANLAVVFRADGKGGSHIAITESKAE